MVRFSAVILVDRRGWLLLQERDEHAPVAPNKWGLVGGKVEEGEDFETAAYRELAEETGLVWTSGLRLWRETLWRYPDRPSPNHYSVWAAATDISDADIVLGEGRQIIFVEPEHAVTLDLGGPAAMFVSDFLSSPTYRRLSSG